MTATLPRRLALALPVLAIAGAAIAQDAAPAPLTRAVLVERLDGDFKKIDANNDGNVTKAEVETAQKKAQDNLKTMIAQRSAEAFTRLDTDKNGQLSKAEFAAAAPTPKDLAPDAAPFLAEFDGNKDGKVTIAEFRAPTVSRFDSADKNRDGTISDSERAAVAAAAPRR